MARRRKQKKRSDRTKDDTFAINPEIPDIPGNQIQLHVKERDLDPFFKSLLNKHTPLPNHVSFRCYDPPTGSELVIGGGMALVLLFIPGLVTIIGSFVYQKYDAFVFFLAGLLFLGFACSVYWVRNKYRDRQDYKAGRYRYGRFLCRYALLIRKKGGCLLFPKHKVIDAQLKKSRTRRGSQWWHLYLDYIDDTGNKASYQIFSGAGGVPIDKPLHAWIQRPLAIRPLVKALEHKDSKVRSRAVTILKDVDWRPDNPQLQTLYFLAQKDWEALIAMGSTISSEILIKALGDHDPAVRPEAAKLLDPIGWDPRNDREQVYYLLASKTWDTFLALGAPTVPDPLLNILGEDGPVFREEITTTLADLYASIESVQFGAPRDSSPPQRFTLYDPDVTDLRFSMSGLKRILIATETYDFHAVERFMTYVINSIGRKHLKNQVEVHLYGDPDRLQRNLRNTFKNLCKGIHVHDE